MRVVRFRSAGCAGILCCASAWAQTWSVVVLHPAGARESWVDAVNDRWQGGTAVQLTGEPYGGIWQGQAATWSPLDTFWSQTLGLDDTTQVGYIDTHAVLWHGVGGSTVDLHPVGLTGLI